MHTPGIITKSFSPSLPPTRHLNYPQMGCPHHPPFTEPPDSVAPEALPPAPKCVLCRIGPFALGVAPAGDSGWKRNLLSPWKRGKTPRQGVGGGWVVLEGGAKTDGKVGPQTPDTSGQLVWGRRGESGQHFHHHARAKGPPGILPDSSQGTFTVINR